MFYVLRPTARGAASRYVCVRVSDLLAQISSKGDKAHAAKEFKCALLPFAAAPAAPEGCDAAAGRPTTSCRRPPKKPRKRRPGFDCAGPMEGLSASTLAENRNLNSLNINMQTQRAQLVPFTPRSPAGCSWDYAPRLAWHTLFGSCWCRAAARETTPSHPVCCSSPSEHRQREDAT